ncbi:MAG: hypothetical protein LBR38_09560 [Synergistaceae bacterium]|nr:hypothetical protein [Synergistaceae bacterium]
MSEEQQAAPKSQAIGICALVFAIISLFIAAIVFVPLAIILGVIGIVKKQYAWAISALVVAIVSALMSPTLWAIFSGATLMSVTK